VGQPSADPQLEGLLEQDRRQELQSPRSCGSRSPRSRSSSSLLLTVRPNQ